MKKVLFILISSSAVGQSNNEDGKIYLNHTNRIECFSLSAKTPRRYDENKIYFWYSRNRLNCTQGGAGGELLHGEYNSRSRSRQLIETGNFRKGLKHGAWKNWNESGRIYEVSHWKNGRLHGYVLSYDGDGCLVSKTIYHKGKATQQQCYVDGKLESTCMLSQEQKSKDR